MKSLEITPQALNAASASLSGKGPINMINLLRFRAKADYGEDSSQPPCTGQEAYFTRYLPAFSAVEGAGSSSVVWIGNVEAILVAPEGERWHAAAIVEYPDIDTLKNIVNSPKYQADASPHRLAALEDFRFIVTTKAGLPG